MGSKRRVVLSILGLLVVLTVVFVIFWMHRLGPVSECLDEGGCWDAEHSRCEFGDQSKCRSPSDARLAPKSP